MENNNLSLYLEEAEKERAAKNLSAYVKEKRLRLKRVKKIKMTIKSLSIVLLLLIIYLVKEVMPKCQK